MIFFVRAFAVSVFLTVCLLVMASTLYTVASGRATVWTLFIIGVWMTTALVYTANALVAWTRAYA